jgi:hypothetical protein
LAVGLDYFVPSRKGQFEIFIDVLKQTTSDEVKTSSQFLLDQLLEYFSGVDTLYRLLQVRSGKTTSLLLRCCCRVVAVSFDRPSCI